MNEIPHIRALLAELTTQHPDQETLKTVFLIRCAVDDIELKAKRRSFSDRLFQYLDQKIKSIATRK